MVGHDYRGFVGKAEEYDRRGAVQFAVLTMLGLREFHYLLDIGCGSLRGGRLFIPYLLPEHYCGIEPAKKMVEEGLLRELGESVLRVKRPTFIYDGEFMLHRAELGHGGPGGRKFDFVLAQAVFCHITIAEIATCLGQVHKVMGAESKLVASFHEASKDDKRERLTYPEVAYYRIETMKALAAKEGLECRRVKSDLFSGTALDEQYARMAWLVMQKGGNDRG